MPSKFQIYVDQSLRQPPEGQAVQQPLPIENQQPTMTNQQQALDPSKKDSQINREPSAKTDDIKYPRYIKEELAPNMKFYFDERKIYPVDGGEFSFEELNLGSWLRRQKELCLKRRCEEVELENEELRQRLEAANQRITILTNALNQVQQQAPASRLSIVPQSLQPGTDGDTSCYGGLNEAPTTVHDLWKTCSFVQPADKFTVPIDQSQYIRENVPTSTPNTKDDKNKRARRMSRPSMGGSPTMKLSPITETSRDCNSKSSSSSSALSMRPLRAEPVMEDLDRPLDPNDPTTYRKFLKSLAEPLDRRQGYVIIDANMPEIKTGSCFPSIVEGEAYLVGKELSTEPRMYTAQLLSDDSDTDIPTKTICLRVDQPQNDWLFYICSELHRRLVRQKLQPDIELSVMNADPAMVYNDGSILIDEHFSFVTIEDYLMACVETNKQFPKAAAALITLEMLQLIRALHACDIIHMNVVPKNMIITGCPSREDISSVEERTSIVKLIGFDYATDMRLIPYEYKFNSKLEHLVTCGMLDEKPWTYEVDWYGVLACIYKMFFLAEMEPIKENGRWKLDHHFNGFPTNVWPALFDNLMNIDDPQETSAIVDSAIKDLSTWVRANVSFVLKESLGLDLILETYCKATSKSFAK